MKAFLIAGLGCILGLAGCQSSDEATPEPATADFTYSGAAQHFTPITFTSTTPNAATYAWDFGDASTATVANPSHTFRKPGTYTVTLRTTSANGSVSISKTLTLAQADTVRILAQRFSGTYHFTNVYEYRYSSATNSIIRTPLPDVTMEAVATSEGLSLFGRNWVLGSRAIWQRSPTSSVPAYWYYSGIGSMQSSLDILQAGDSLRVDIKTSSGIGASSARSGVFYYGGRKR
ncbi:PKD domain-containing protein [Hymenobacter aquaticus]|nr:PKD domain-containing protein [Hymenobacter aquaticus]